MKVGASRLLFLASALLLVLVAVQFWRTLREPAAMLPAVTKLAPGITQRASDFHRSQIKNGKTVWEVSAAQVEYSQASNEAAVHNVTLRWYLKDGRFLGIHSDFGKLRLAGTELQGVDVGGNVEFTLGSYALQLPSASYDRPSEKIFSPGPVILQGTGLEVRASKLEVDLQSNCLTLDGDVRMVLRPNEAGKDLPQAPS